MLNPLGFRFETSAISSRGSQVAGGTACSAKLPQTMSSCHERKPYRFSCSSSRRCKLACLLRLSSP